MFLGFFLDIHPIRLYPKVNLVHISTKNMLLSPVQQNLNCEMHCYLVISRVKDLYSIVKS